MEAASLLSSVNCGKCKSSLLFSVNKGKYQIYRCDCEQKVRALLECFHCQKSFLNLPCLIRKSNYCSVQCYRNETNKKQIKSCQVCGKEFRIKHYLVKKGYGFYCSKQCWFTLFKTWEKSTKCIQCGKIFTVPRSVYKKNPKFCSKKCTDDFKRDYVKNICQGCKKEFELPRSDFNRGRGSFCTRECFKHYDGETSIERKIRLELEKLNETFVQEAKFGRFYADFFLPERKLIIECDGEYWHRGKIKKDRDKRKDKLLKELGYKVIRLEEEKIKSKDLDLSNFLSL